MCKLKRAGDFPISFPLLFRFPYQSFTCTGHTVEFFFNLKKKIKDKNIIIKEYNKQEDIYFNGAALFYSSSLSVCTFFFCSFFYFLKFSIFQFLSAKMDFLFNSEINKVSISFVLP